MFNRLYPGDCVEGLARLPAGSVDLAFADPPFNIGYDYDVYDDRRDGGQYLAWTRRWGEAVTRALKPTGTFWLAIGDEYAAELKLLFQNELGFACRSWVVWYYTFGVHCTHKFSRSHAHLFYFVRDPKHFTFNGHAIRVPSARQLVYADARADAAGRVPDDTWILRPQDLPDGFRRGEDSWYFPRVCGTFKERAGWHGCQMPEQLLGRIIRACSNPGDVVLDPFAGSGTTLAAAKKLGRRWVGFELSANYVARIEARLAGAAEGQPLEGAEEPQVSAPRTPRGGVAGSGDPRPARVVLADRPRRGAAEIRRGVIEAFCAVREGFPADRVVADPELHERFHESCRRLGLPGRPGDWSRLLLNLRKAGYFRALPRARRTPLSADDIDRYGFACEIALQRLKEEGRTLDEALCEPAEAARLDRLVRSMTDPAVPSLLIRWLALHVRKRAKAVRQAGREVAAPQELPAAGEPAAALDWGRVPERPGLYALRGPDRHLYVGETRNLRERLRVQLDPPGFDFWDTGRDRLDVRYCELPGGDRLRKGNQSCWIARWRPVGNYADFAAGMRDSEGMRDEG